MNQASNGQRIQRGLVGFDFETVKVSKNSLIIKTNGTYVFIVVEDDFTYKVCQVYPNDRGGFAFVQSHPQLCQTITGVQRYIIERYVNSKRVLASKTTASQKELGNYFERFFEEKELPYRIWTIDTGINIHQISNEVVIESIKNAPISEQRQVRNVLVAIDFKNGDVNHFLEHLANALANTYDGILSS